MSREMAKFFKGSGKTLSEGSPTLAMGFYPPRVFPQPIPFGNGTRVVSLANSGAWGVAIVGKLFFSPSRGTPGLPQGIPPINYFR